MSKAILVIDMPSCCGNCDLCTLYYDEQFEESEYKCFATKENVELDNDFKLSSCPLKPMPEKEEGSMWNTDIGEYYEGYNACIDEILGDTE